MDLHLRKKSGSPMEIQVITGGTRPEIVLEGPQLLKLEPGQPGTRVFCTAGTLWLTQQGDPDDHILHSGQSLTLDRRGIILVQGLPRGKALILELREEPLYNRKQTPGGSRWTQFLNRYAP